MIEQSQTKTAISAILDYLWDDELKDFAASPSDDHIFRQLVTLDNLLSGNQLTAEEYVDEIDGS